MAKKKERASQQTGKEELQKEMELLIKQLGLTEDQNRIQRMANGFIEMINHPELATPCEYKHPDYTQKVEPIADYMKIIYEWGWNFDAPGYIVGDWLKRPREQLIKDTENLIINCLAEFHDLTKNEYPDSESYIIVSVLLLQEIHSEKSLDIVLEMLRQNPKFIDAYFQDDADTIIPPFICSIGLNQLPKLLQFIKEPKLDPINKEYIIRGVCNIAYLEPLHRLEIIYWVGEVLHFLYEHKTDKTIFSSRLVDAISNALIDIQAVELLPILEKIYAEATVTPYIAPDINEIHEKISGEKIEGFEMDDIYQTLEYLDDEYGFLFEDDDDNWDDDEGWEIKKNSDTKCYTLRISIADISPEIWRQISLPSFTTLAKLHQIIQTAMGWENCHLHQFIKGKICYIDATNDDDGYENNKDYTGVTIADLLARKGSKITYEYDFGDSWNHTILLEEQHIYKKGEKQNVSLLNGENACPPEDCGGYPGYMNLVEAMKHPRSKSYKEQVEWLGKPFHPTKFDLKKISKKINAIKL